MNSENSKQPFSSRKNNAKSNGGSAQKANGKKKGANSKKQATKASDKNQCKK